MNNGQKTLESMSQAGWYNRWLIGKIKRCLHGDILEVGSGIGNFTLELAKYGRVVSIDISKSYIEKTQKFVGGQAKVGLGDIEKGRYFFSGRKFDTIVCLNVLEHIKDDIKALGNLYRLLGPNGNLILLVPSHPSLYGLIDKSIDHFRRYDKKGLANMLLGLGFSVEENKRLNFLGALGWWFAGKILKKQYVEGSKIAVFNLLAPLVLRLENLIEPPLGISVLVVARRDE